MAHKPTDGVFLCPFLGKELFTHEQRKNHWLLLEEARKKSGASKLVGHDIMDLERFAPDTRVINLMEGYGNDNPGANGPCP